MMCMSLNHLMNKKMTIKFRKNINIAIFVIVFQVFSACKEKNVSYNGEVYRLDENKYGYNVLYKGKIFIKQETIPSIEGNKRFNDSIDALKVLDLVLIKLNDGKNPSVTKQDLKKLNIIN